MLAGVCRALANITRVPAALIRIAFLVGCFIVPVFTPLAYIMLWASIPIEPRPKSRRRPHRDEPSR